MRDETARVNGGAEQRSRFVFRAVMTDGLGETQKSRSSSARTMKPNPTIGIADATKSVRRACGVGGGTGSTTLPAGVTTDASDDKLPMGVGADEDCVKSIAVVDLFLRRYR
jgi:hypothetical protein